jgi:crotonobetainyl-CoA:carnitine CoA-transferase CaiB-like acyl-CoA transferase
LTDSPLDGIRILDLTRLLPGAFCTMLLAGLGAEVIKIEEPGTGDYMRWTPPLVDGQSELFNALNRGKRSVTLNLKTSAGRDLLIALAGSAAVLVEGNRPGVMQRLGLGWEVLHRANPKLVMCSITGYGQDGPFAARAGHDLNYLATAGVLGLNGPSDGPPHPLPVQVADVAGGGLQPAVAILGALVAVERGGEGRWIDASMTDSAASFLSLAFAARSAGERVARGDQRLDSRYPCYRVYACKDGGYYSVGALEPKFWVTLCEALGRKDLIDKQFAEDRSAHAELETIFASRTRDEWEQKLSALDACCEPVLELDEVASHPQIAARGVLVRMREGKAPGLGEDTEDVLTQLGIDAARLEGLRQSAVV